MTGSGEFTDRVTFQLRGVGDDGQGNQVTNDWVDQFTVYAKLLPLRGGEEVMAGRLAGRQPYVLTIRQSSNTRRITPSWRAYDARAGLDAKGQPRRSFDVKAPPVDPDRRRAEFEVLVELVVRN